MKDGGERTWKGLGENVGYVKFYALEREAKFSTRLAPHVLKFARYFQTSSSHTLQSTGFSPDESSQFAVLHSSVALKSSRRSSRDDPFTPEQASILWSERLCIAYFISMPNLCT